MPRNALKTDSKKEETKKRKKNNKNIGKTEENSNKIDEVCMRCRKNWRKIKNIDFTVLFSVDKEQ